MSKSKLKFETKKTYHVDYKDLDTFVQNGLGFSNFEFVAVEEVDNHTTHDYSIEKEELDKYDKEIITDWQNHKFTAFSAHTVLTHACNLGLIPEGDYSIAVYW